MVFILSAYLTNFSKFFIIGPESDTSFSIEKCNDLYKITYIPLEIGLFDINILWNGQELPSKFKG